MSGIDEHRGAREPAGVVDGMVIDDDHIGSLPPRGFHRFVIERSAIQDDEETRIRVGMHRLDRHAVAFGAVGGRGGHEVPDPDPLEKKRHLGDRRESVAIVVAGDDDLAAPEQMVADDPGGFVEIPDAAGIRLQALEPRLQRGGIESAAGEEDREDILDGARPARTGNAPADRALVHDPWLPAVARREARCRIGQLLSLSSVGRPSQPLPALILFLLALRGLLADS
ncbi:MAG: hypothetical protein V1774_01455 [Candidatus Eisenbacteria bacterium]